MEDVCDSAKAKIVKTSVYRTQIVTNRHKWAQIVKTSLYRDFFRMSNVSRTNVCRYTLTNIQHTHTHTHTHTSKYNRALTSENIWKHCNNTTTRQQHDNNTATTRQQHGNNTATTRQHCNNTATLQQHGNTATTRQHCNNMATLQQHGNSDGPHGSTAEGGGIVQLVCTRGPARNALLIAIGLMFAQQVCGCGCISSFGFS